MYEIQPEIMRIITPTIIPASLKRIGKVSIVPPIIELTRAHIVLQEGFNYWLIYIINVFIKMVTISANQSINLLSSKPIIK